MGDQSPVACFWFATDKPETFFYADARPKVFPNARTFTPANVPPGMWVILSANEKVRWLAYLA